MKTRIRFISLLLVICMTVSVTSCGVSAYEEKEREETVTEINQTIKNEITIEGSHSNAVYATAKGLRSAVSVYCTFTATTGGTSYWNPYPTTQTYYSTGSGVIYKLDGRGNAFIVTNFHVVYDASSDTENKISDRINVYLYGLETEECAIPATYVGGSANYDIAVLRIDGSEVLASAVESGAATAIDVANSDEIAPGQTTITIGNPSATDLGGLSVTSGIVSVASEYITMNAADNSGSVEFRVIRTDAAVNSGNSGGGMFNDEGELIGIVNAKISDSSIENIGYAIPSNVVRAIADNIIHYCYLQSCENVMRGMLGVTVQANSPSTSYDGESGLIIRTEEVTVIGLSSGGLAEQILREGDVIKEIRMSGKAVKITRTYHLIDAMLDVRVGERVSMIVERDGKEIEVSTVIVEECLSAY